MIWLTLHSIAVVTLASLALGSGASQTVTLLLSAEAALAFGWLFVDAGRDALRPANLLTGVRLLVSLAIIALLSVDDPSARLFALVFGAAILAEITDLLDGQVARRSGTTAFGARLDMETDALFILALSLLLVAWFDLPRWVAAAGLVRYVVAIPFLALPEPRFSRTFSLFAKSACAIAAVLLIAAALPPTIAPQLRPALASGRLALAAAAVALLLVSFGWEAVARVRARSRVAVDRALRLGLLRSILTYYGVPFRRLAMRRFYRTFVGPGDLVFDVGAHVGNRIPPLRALGARVVAVEPQPHCARLLRRLYGPDDAVFLVEAACGREESHATLHVSREHPTLSTLSRSWTEAIDHHYADHGIEWDREITVRTTSLDALIERFGQPCFVKVDVEGFEAEVLAGLSHPVPALSFEFLPASIDSAIECLAQIGRLGVYRFSYSMVETMRLATDRWIGGDEMAQILKGMPADGRSGDVYAVRENS